MKVLLLPNRQKAEAKQIARKAGDILAGDGLRLLFCQQDAGYARTEWNPAVLALEDAFRECELVVTIGGDGTLLHAARHLIGGPPKPLLGINIGRLGFLTLIESNELELLHKIAKKQYSVEHRSVLCAKTDDHSCYALNDIVLFKEQPEHTVPMDIFCDDILVSRFRGDGVIFSTPTGSTAYSMSAGGPILDARIQGIVVTQICAHIVHTPPLVVASSRKLRAVPTGAEGENVRVLCDGAKAEVVLSGQAIDIAQSDLTMPLIRFQEGEQLKLIDKKLKGRES